MILPWKTLLLLLTALWLLLATIGLQQNPRNRQIGHMGNMSEPPITEEATSEPGLGRFELSAPANVLLERLTLLQQQMSVAGPGLQWMRVAPRLVANSTNRMMANLSRRLSQSDELVACPDDVAMWPPDAPGLSPWEPILEDFKPSAEAMTNTIVLFSISVPKFHSNSDRDTAGTRWAVSAGQADAASKRIPARVSRPTQAMENQRFWFARPVPSRLRRF